MSENGNVELQIKATNLTQQAFDAVSTALKSLEVAQAATSSAGGAAVSSAFKKSSGEVKLEADALKVALFEAFDHPFQAARIAINDTANAVIGGLETISTEAVTAVGVIGAIAGAFVYLLDRGIEAGTAIEDFSLKTSTSVEFASRLTSAARVLGTSVEELGNLIFKSDVQMDQSPQKYADGLKNIGLSMKNVVDLKPEDRFRLISDAFRENTTEMNRSTTAVDLFGRAGRDAVPTLMKPLGDLMDRAATLGHVMSDDDVAAAETLHLAWGELKEEASSLTDRLGILTVNLVRHSVGIDDESTSIDRLIKKIQKLGNPLAMGAALPDITMSAKQQERAIQGLDEDYKKLVAQRKADQEYAEKALEAWDNLTEGGKALDESVRSQIVDWLLLGKSQGDIAHAYGIAESAVRDVKQAIDETNKSIEESRKLGEAAAKAINAGMGGGQDVLMHMAVAMGDVQLAASPLKNFDLIGALMPGDALVKRAAQHVRDVFGDTLSDQMGDVFRTDIPASILHAVEGGGSVWDAAATSLGQGFSKSLTEQLSTSFASSTGVLGKLFSGNGMLSGLVSGGLTTAIGAGVSLLTKFLTNIGGPSAQEVEGRKAENPFEQQMGGLAGMQKALMNAGLSADATNAKIQALWAAEKSGGAAVQAQIDSINALIKQHAADVSAGVQSINDAAKIVGTNFPKALQPVVEQLASLPGLTDAEKKSLLALTRDGTPSLKDLTDTASKYGLTLDDLGGKTQQLSISTRADEIETDFKNLTDSGADYGNTINHFSKSVSSLVDDAEKYGSALPTAMKPIVEALFKAGELTDSTGKKIDDMSNITFDDANDPLAKGLSTLTDAINNLSKLLGGLPDDAKNAADGIGKNLGSVKIPPIDVHYKYVDDGGDGAPSYAARGGITTSRGVKYYGDGVEFVPMGTDVVPAMLSPGEGILNTSATAYLGPEAIGSLNAGRGLAFDTSGLERHLSDLNRMTKATHRMLQQLLTAQPNAFRDALLLAGVLR